MLPALHLPGSRNADAWLARSYGFPLVAALLPILLTFLAPATAWGDIYKWTDERGNMVISNVQPVASSSVSDVELLATAARPAAQSPAASSQQAATPTEQALEARIENLERQLQPQQYALPPQADPQSGYPGDYYPAAVPPPPDSGYYGSYDPGYNQGFYPGYYPSFYNPWPASYSFITIPARPFVRRPVLVPRPHGFVGRPPTFAGRPPTFAGRPPAVVSRPPAIVAQPSSFASRPLAISSRPAFGGPQSVASGGGSMHGGRR